MNSPKCATIRDSLALLTKSHLPLPALLGRPNPDSYSWIEPKGSLQLMWGHFNWKDPSFYWWSIVNIFITNLYFLSPIFRDLMSAIILDVEIVLQPFLNMKKILWTFIDDATIFWGKWSEFLSCLSFLQDTFLYSLRDITISSKCSAGFFWSNLCSKAI